MATYNPPSELFAVQLDSIRAQTHGNWVCVISDDCSSPERFAALQAAVGEDPRFIVSRSPRRLGFYRNFERALSIAPSEAEYLAMADQDDRWYPDKLARLLAGIGGAPLIYSDMRIVARDGGLISHTYWSRRLNNHTDLLSLMVANYVTGAASLLRRDLLDDALPFPPARSLTTTTTGSGCAPARSERSVSSPTPSTTTCSTGPRRSGTPPRTGCRLWLTASPRCAPAASASAPASGECTTSSTLPGSSSSRPCC